MDDPGRPRALPVRHALFDRDDWKRVRNRLLYEAYRRTGDRARSKDLAHAAILKCLEDPRAPWKLPYGLLALNLTQRVVQAISNAAAHDEKFPEGQGLDDTPDDLDVVRRGLDAVLASPDPSPEAIAAEAETEAIFRGRFAALARKTEDDAVVCLLVDAVRRGEEDPMKEAIAEGHKAADVYNARKRLRRAAEEVLEDERKRPAGQEKEMSN